MDIRKYIYSHCIHPTRVKVYDAYTNSHVYKEVPCGQCLHCQNQSINDWVTRLEAQALHSPYIYYITLDYAPFDVNNETAMQLAAETAAAYHSLNKTRHYALHPVVLCKNHLQDYLKRFRKNTGKKIQFFACGEYGKAWSRPHFHLIVFCNQPISQDEFQHSWCVNGYKIGNVDYNDLRANGTMTNNKRNIFRDNSLIQYNQQFVFRYVCKYLFKDKDAIKNLKTYDYHYAYFLSRIASTKNLGDLFTPSQIEFPDEKTMERLWEDYNHEFAPFVRCSRRPAIGLQYLQENLQRFEKADFRLFGLPTECESFPRYFVRKAKEARSRFVALGQDSFNPSSPARMPYIVSVLNKVRDTRMSFGDSEDTAPLIWRESSDKKECYYSINQGIDQYTIECFKKTDLHFYDTIDKCLYIFNGYSYDIWCKFNRLEHRKIDTIDIVDVLNKITPYIQGYKTDFVDTPHVLQSIRERELLETIRNQFPDTYETKKDTFKYYDENHIEHTKTTELLKFLPSEKQFTDYIYKVYQEELRNRRSYLIKKQFLQNSF
jgi:hypothetical protein